MDRFAYRTRGKTDPTGKPNVYICCHPDDRALYLEAVADELLAIQDCAVWFAKNGDEVRDEDFLEILTQRMHLVVMPVTGRLLEGSNPAMREFFAAREAGLCVLPLMQAVGLERDFTRVCGQLQYLDRVNTDPTAIPYDEKLKKYLSSVLVDSALSDKVRSAFDAYVFLSYRKKDRKYANALMRMIHADEACRDVAIWYDEYLIPGEDFNEAIDRMLRRCDLFVMAVTPNLVEESNYVMRIEYPMAREAGKPVVPVELVPTDKEALFRQFAGLSVCFSDRELTQELRQQLRALALDERNSTPQHLYYIGLAYLNGIDVEVDRKRGVELITRAAEGGCVPAMEKLVDIHYYDGDLQLQGSKWLNKRLELVRDPGSLSCEQAMEFMEFCENHEMSGRIYGGWNVVDWVQCWVAVSRIWDRDPRRKNYDQALQSCAAVMTALLQGKLATLVLSGHEEYPDRYYELGVETYRELEEWAATMEDYAKALLGRARLESGYIRRSRNGLVAVADSYINDTIAVARRMGGSRGARYEVYAWLEMDELVRLEQKRSISRPVISEPMDFGEMLSSRPSILRAEKLEYDGDIAALQQAVKAAKRLEGNELEDHKLCLRLMRTCAKHFEWKKDYEQSIRYWREAADAARKIWEQTLQERDGYEYGFVCGCVARACDQIEQLDTVGVRYLDECFARAEALYAVHGWDIDDYGYLYRDCVAYLAGYWKSRGNSEKHAYYEALSEQCLKDDQEQVNKKLSGLLDMWNEMKKLYGM